MTTDRGLYTLPAAAEWASVSVQTIRRAILSTSPTAFPPPLKAKRLGKRDANGNPTGPYRIKAADLSAWVDSLPDG